jgi:hypothetical protein
MGKEVPGQGALAGADIKQRAVGMIAQVASCRARMRGAARRANAAQLG